MVDKIKIGKIQVCLGIILFIITIIGSIVIINNFIELFVEANSNEAITWGEISDKLSNESAEGALIKGLVVSEIVTKALILKTAEFIFGMSAFILLVLSTMLILQGLANQSKR